MSILCQSLFVTLALLVIQLFLLLPGYRSSALRLSLVVVLLLDLSLLLLQLELSLSLLDSTFSCDTPLLFLALSLGFGKLLLTNSLDCSNLFLTFTLDSTFSLFLSELFGKLVVAFLLLLSLFLLGKDGLKLLDRTSMLISQLLQLRSMLLFLLALARFFILLVFTHELSHQLVCLLR